MSTLNLERVTMCQDVIARIHAIIKDETFPALESTDPGFITALDKLVSIIMPLEAVRTPGSVYYTITKIYDIPTIVTSIDDGKALDRERFDKKLYFNNLADAEFTLARMTHP